MKVTIDITDAEYEQAGKPGPHVNAEKNIAQFLRYAPGTPLRPTPSGARGSARLDASDD
jgi:hypothetical protein